jgi:hypothetical protein
MNRAFGRDGGTAALLMLTDRARRSKLILLRPLAVCDRDAGDFRNNTDTESMDLLDAIPLWGWFLATVAIVVLSVEAGFRIGGYRRRRTEQEKEAPVGAIVAAILGLLAFVLAFTFGLAASRFDTRRQIVVKESNAIGTAYLRAGLLPAPHDGEARKLLRDYVDARLRAVQPGELDEAMTKSAELQYALWSQATDAARKDPRSIVTGLFIQSLNEVIDVHSERVMIGLRNRIPIAVWLGLYFVTAIAMGGVGYHEGLSGSRRSLVVIALALTFSAVILLIADLDRPQEGMLKVSQQAMVDLRDFIKDSRISVESTKP